MNFIKTIIGKTTGRGICLNLLLALALAIIPAIKVEAGKCRDDDAATQRLALRLESTLAQAVIARNVKQLVRIVSPIFQGIDGGIFIRSKAQEIQLFLDSNIATINFNNLFATRHKNVLVITFNITGTRTDGSTFNDNDCSVWQRVSRKNCKEHHNDHHHKQHGVKVGIDGWQLVSMNSVPGF